MIKVSIYRTNEEQIKAKGRNAWTNMTFMGGYTKVIKAYCERLAEDDGIIDPLIEVVES